MDGRIKTISLLCVIVGVYGEGRQESLGSHFKAMGEQFDQVDGIDAKFEMVQALFDGLRLLGNTLRSIVMLGSEDNKKHNMELQGKITKDDVKVDFIPNITLVSVESGGLVENTIEVKVNFKSGKRCLMKWNVQYEHSVFLSWKGDMDEKMIDDKRRFCFAKFKVSDVDILEAMNAVIYGLVENVQMTFNIQALHNAGTEQIEEFKYNILKYSPDVEVSKERLDVEGFETVVEVSNNVIDRIKDGYPTTATTFFTYINATANPAEIKTISSTTNENVFVKVKNGSTNELVFGVKPASADFNGELHILVKQGQTAFLHDHQYDVTIRVMHEGSQFMVPYGQFAVKKNKEVEYLYGKYHSISCLGATAIWPRMRMSKFTGRRTESLSIDFDDYDENDDNENFRLQVVNFGPENIENAEGLYNCGPVDRSIYGGMSVTLRKHGEIEIYDSESRLVENSENQTEVSCFATGYPPPVVELLRNDVNGDDLMKSEDVRYKHKIKTSAGHAEVVLTIKPIDRDITTVVCKAYQIIRGKIVDTKYFPIAIPPGN